MIRQYFKQAWRILKENPVLSIITILGTALSICMIMVQVMTENVKYGHLPPETKRDRMLMVTVASVKVTHKNGYNQNWSPFGLKLVKELFEPMTTCETVGFFSSGPNMPISVPGLEESVVPSTKYCSEGYWKFFDYNFIDGAPFSESDVRSGTKKAVISRTVAEKVFGDVDVVGRTFQFFGDEVFQVCGVVEPVSVLARYANAGMWIPYTSTKVIMDKRDEISGNFIVMILAKSRKDFKKIRAEVASMIEKRANHDPNTEIDIYSQPDTYRLSTYREPEFNEEKIDYSAKFRKSFLLYLLFLLVPAINLGLMTNSRMSQRAHEIGVRRCYGATRPNILWQVVWESFLFTLLGSILGLILSVGGVYSFQKVLFKGFDFERLHLSLWDYLQPRVLLMAIVFCLLLNLVSAIIPAIQYAKSNIIRNLYNE